MSTTRWRRVMAERSIGLYIFGLAALGAIALGSLALDGGDSWRRGAMASERDAPWTPAIQAIDEALARGDVNRAARTWPDAYRAAAHSRRWEGLVAAGDARLRIARISDPGRVGKSKARETYAAALLRARQEGSLDGVLRVAEAFDALGDTDVTAEALRIAEAVAGPNPSPTVLARMAVLRERTAGRFATGPREREAVVAEP